MALQDVLLEVRNAAANGEGEHVTALCQLQFQLVLQAANRLDQLGYVRIQMASGGAIHAVPEDEVGANMSLLAATSGVFGETAAGVTVGALVAAARAGQLGEGDRVVVLVTGTGLKTPNVVEVGAGREIEADVDVLLDALGVPA